MTLYLWNNRLKQRVRFSYWNELCVIRSIGGLQWPPPI
ncbi:Uncharacterised protein [Serratia quinivorans]|nr:Uncharacterised protein [Serratia quinivorans]CAI2028000.1 Uncharacterised protein [Serratia quinivorans]